MSKYVKILAIANLCLINPMLYAGNQAKNTPAANPTKTMNGSNASTNNTNQTTTNTKKDQKMNPIVKKDSGLSYQVLTPSTGTKPKVGQTVTVHYSGYLNNNGELGKKFDSSVDRGTPFSTKIGVGYVIAGWDEGLLDMQVGEKRRLYIPAKLGYGARGAGAAIPPNADLIFDVELLAVN